MELSPTLSDLPPEVIARLSLVRLDGPLESMNALGFDKYFVFWALREVDKRCKHAAWATRGSIVKRDLWNSAVIGDADVSRAVVGRSSPRDIDDALVAACLGGHADVVECLLEAGANPTAFGGEAIHNAYRRKDVRVMEMLRTAMR